MPSQEAFDAKLRDLAAAKLKKLVTEAVDILQVSSAPENWEPNARDFGEAVVAALMTNTCDECRAKVAYIIGCPGSGREICRQYFDLGIC
jgi:hypothetical protein